MGPPPSAPEIDTPLAASERLVALDLIRGIAVLGILLANVTGFAHPDIAYYWPGALPGGGNAADGWVWLVQFVAVDGKLRSLFTILFGAGLAMFVDRKGGDRHAVSLQARRLGWLMLFGLLHFTLLFNGDILFSYACAGLIGLLALKLPGEKLVALGLVWLLVAGVFQTLAYVTPALIEAGRGATQYADVYRVAWSDQLAEAARQAQVLGQGSYADVLRYRVVEEGHMLLSYVRWCFFETIPMLLLGMGLYRCGLFAPPIPGDPAPGWRWWAAGAVAVGLALNLATGLYVMASNFPPYLTMAAFFGTSAISNLPLIVGGTALLARWAARTHGGWLATRLAQAGRMAFSNYIATSLLMVVLFQGWAGDHFGTMHRLDLLLVVLLGWAMMLSFSRLWLSRFRYGPLEWLWRSLTYWRRFPNRLSLDQQPD
jgi:uncharacterized protein